MKYIAFLRGINVGGHKQVSMEELRTAFGSLAFKGVKTLLVSGNVLFEAPAGNGNTLVAKIENKLKEVFGHEIGVVLRPLADLQKLAEANPFKNIKITPDTRVYVTFLKEKPKTGSKIQSESRDFKIVWISDNEVCTAITVSPQRQTTDLMNFVEKEFGRKVTTRNWNTIVRILKSDSSK